MHALEQCGQEVVQGHQEGVSPLAGEVQCEGGVLLRGQDEGQSKPITPLRRPLKLRPHALKELLGLVLVPLLENTQHGSH